MKNEKKVEICSSCIHQSNCVYRNKETQTPVLQCEQFEAEPAAATPVHESFINSGENDNVTDTDNQYTGLCRTCALNKTCKYVNPGQGVLQCEEYQE